MEVNSWKHNRAITITSPNELFAWLDEDRIEDRDYWIIKYFNYVDQHIATHGTTPRNTGRDDPRAKGTIRQESGGEPETASADGISATELETLYRDAGILSHRTGGRRNPVQQKGVRRFQKTHLRRKTPLGDYVRRNRHPVVEGAHGPRVKVEKGAFESDSTEKEKLQDPTKG